MLPRSLAAITALIVVLAVVLMWAPAVDAHAQLESSSPPADALLSVPPAEIVLRYTEPIDASSASVRMVDESGAEIALEPPRIDGGDPRTVRVATDGVGFGTLTVSWSTRSATDGHTLSGSFAFRVGGTSRAPAAATVEGDRPAAWNVATRWLTFLGLSLATGSLLVGWSPRRRRLVAVGAVVALGASLAEPVLLRLTPPAGWATPSLTAAFRAQPEAWWLRPAAAIAVLVATVLVGRRAGTVWGIGGGGLVGLMGLALTAHASGRESLRLPALLSTILHEWSVALWVGGLLLVALGRGDGWGAELRSFSRRVLPIALVAIVSGVANAGFLYPSLERLRAIRETDYGWVLIVKVAVVAVVLLLAGLHRVLLRRSGEPAASFRLTLPAEAAVAVVAVVVAATLAMLAPPGAARVEDAPTTLTFAQPATPAIDGDQLFIRLAIEPQEDERRRLVVSATDGIPLRSVPKLEGGVEIVTAPTLTDLQLGRVTLTSLSAGLAPTTMDLEPVGDGTFARDGFAFAVAGWWQADVTIRRPGAEDTTVTFYLIEPDPNVVGFDAIDEQPEAADAERVQAGARALLDARTSYTYVEVLNSGDGSVELIGIGYTENGGGEAPRAVEIRSPGLRMIRIDGERYIQRDGGAWQETPDSPVLSAAEVATDYDGVEQIGSLGQEKIDGDLCERIALYVPGTTLAPAWYIWWVSVETGELRQEAMVSRAHYMTKRYTEVNAPTEIVAPALAP